MCIRDRIMAVAAGKSAEEKRWVSFTEMAGDLCAMGGKDACEADVVSSSGALNFETLLSPSMGIVMAMAPKVEEPSLRSPSKLFERIASAVWIPPARKDLQQKKLAEAERQAKFEAALEKAKETANSK